jgi:hypothetical protein
MHPCNTISVSVSLSFLVRYVFWTYELLACLGPDSGGGGSEVDAVEELVPARLGVGRDEIVEAQKLSCA